MKEEVLFRLLLRVTGSASLLAVFAVVMPYSQMNAIHQWLGMGLLPDEPIVGYLARSTSFFYAFLGGLMWVISFDLRRYRAVVCFIGYALAVLGITLFIVDFAEGLPRFWVWFEGPCDFLFGLLFLYFGRRLPSAV